MKKLLVIGGGIGGLSAAVALRRAGADAAVCHDGEFSEVPAAVVVWPNAARVLREWGLLAALLPEGRVLSQVDLLKHDGKAMASFAVGGTTDPAVCLHRAELHRALRMELSPDCLAPGRRLISFVQGTDAVSARFGPFGLHEDGVTMTADGLVGADGAQSIVRRELCGAVAPAYRGYHVWRGIAPDAGQAPSSHLSETWGRGRRFGIVPMGRRRICWYATHNGPPLEPSRDPADTKRLIQRLFVGWHAPVAALIEATDAESIVGANACDLPPLRRWGSGRATLLGDAAHPLTPNVGQGACSAIEDASALGKAVEAIGDLPAAFRAYEAARRPKAATLSRRARQIGILGQLEHPWLAALRDGCIRAAVRFDIVRPGRLMLYDGDGTTRDCGFG